MPITIIKLFPSHVLKIPQLIRKVVNAKKIAVLIIGATAFTIKQQ
jgi:hypothetical protein